MRMLLVLAIALSSAVFAFAGEGRESVARLFLAAGMPAVAAHLSHVPAFAGYAFLQAGDYARAAEVLKDQQDPISTYNRGEALARVGDVGAALESYDRTLGSHHVTRTLVADAGANRQLLLALTSLELQGGGHAKTNAAAFGEKDRSSGDPNDSGSETATSGAGRAGDKESDSQAKAPGGSRVARLGKSREGDGSGVGDARGSAGDAGGAGRSGGQASAAVITMAEMQRNVQKRATERSVPATKQWLKTLTDDPGAFLKLQLVAEMERRKREGLALDPLADTW
ncbi:hypothetical protein [Aureimonas glaciei]|uniref:Tetratricopeptide repeat protein n=1 Tax=Aureimonas glaciei TaxID=1776957 RepID=A0A917DB27_9HYPH|nr:hypothetical protein [Aureimonas glaciei]GGD21044.1 hypothetical protein GCM10011335_24980 [Aureimonas glaciei]